METVSVIDELKTQHAALETKLDAEAQRPQPNQTVVAQLKREKLRIKDQIANMQRD